MADPMPPEPGALDEFPTPLEEHAPPPNDDVAAGLVLGPEEDIGETNETYGFRLRRGNGPGWFACLPALDSTFA